MYGRGPPRSSGCCALIRMRRERVSVAALEDDDFLVRVAATRAVGLARDRAAADRLIRMLADDELAVRRQAATALGRLGERRAVPALLKTAATAADRFVEHAVIYSLIQLSDAGATRWGLTDVSPKVQKAALIALDQMEGRPLRRESAVSLVSTGDPELRKAVLWVLGQHPEWSSDVLAHVRKRFGQGGVSKDEEASLDEALLNLCKEPGAQSVVAGTADRAGRNTRAAVGAARDGSTMCGRAVAECVGEGGGRATRRAG